MLFFVQRGKQPQWGLIGQCPAVVSWFPGENDQGACSTFLFSICSVLEASKSWGAYRRERSLTKVWSRQSRQSEMSNWSVFTNDKHAVSSINIRLWAQESRSFWRLMNEYLQNSTETESPQSQSRLGDRTYKTTSSPPVALQKKFPSQPWRKIKGGKGKKKSTISIPIKLSWSLEPLKFLLPDSPILGKRGSPRQLHKFTACANHTNLPVEHLRG